MKEQNALAEQSVGLVKWCSLNARFVYQIKQTSPCIPYSKSIERLICWPLFSVLTLDNYSYIILDEKTSEAAVVDPVEPQKLMHILQHLGAKLTSVLSTHHHWDHAGGNIELISKKPGLAVYGADARIPEINYVVKDKEEFKIGNITIQALWTHCHTKGSISYYAKDGNERAVFTGDTLFLSTFFSAVSNGIVCVIDKAEANGERESTDHNCSLPLALPPSH